MHALAALATVAALLAPPTAPATSSVAEPPPGAPTVAVAPRTSPDVVPVFARIDLGEAAPGEPAPGTIWLANLADRAVRFAGVKGSCGCIAFGADAPHEIGARRVASIPVSMRTPGEPGASKEKTVTIALDDGSIVRILLAARSADADEIVERAR